MVAAAVFLFITYGMHKSHMEHFEKECFETEYWLELLFETGYIPESTYKPLRNQCGAIRRMLISSLNTAKEGCR